jgi:hypothetical protein
VPKVRAKSSLALVSLRPYNYRVSRWFKVVLIVLLLAAVLTPFIELVDSWDGPIDSGYNDSEMQFVAALVWAGLVLVMGKLLLLRPTFRVIGLDPLSDNDCARPLDSMLTATAAASPPLPLRI